MSRKSWAIHRSDSTAKALIAEAQQMGAQYLPVNGIIDGILFFHGRTILVEWKGPKTPVTPKQAELVELGWPIRFIRDSDQLIDVLRKVA